ncbi:FK506-binding protein 4-like isoform X1 [Ananas comosus]|uniref:FK506-binding protein 4-like isoform X1 n=1 Tax=Ananas comosus TaxID=4615 RepID=A0A6P5EKZ8_ANACO|nr:FK506-binding protein 4-like isoform X1 [Ananas comosus]
MVYAGYFPAGHVKRVCKQKAKSPTIPLDRKAQWKSKKDDPKNKQTWKPKKEDPKTNAKQTWKRKKDDPKKKIAQIVDKQHISQSSRPTQPKTRKVWVREGIFKTSRLHV